MFESDPIKRRQRELEAEQKALANQSHRLRHELDALKHPVPLPVKPTVWHDSEKKPAPRITQRTHGAQRRRDRAKFLLLAFCFILVVIWLVGLIRR